VTHIPTRGGAHDSKARRRFNARVNFCSQKRGNGAGGILAYDTAPVPPVHIRLTRKLAALLNGLDLSRVEVGDVIFLPEPHAIMLIREGWAEPVTV